MAWQSILADQGPVVRTAGQPRASSVCSRRCGSWTTVGCSTPGRGDRRPHLQLPAVHGAAHLREPGEDRRPPRRRRQGPLLDRRSARSARSCSRSRCPASSPAACSTFIPAAGDFINAEFLGGPNTTMIGNSIQDQFLNQNNYPTGGGDVVRPHVIITIGVAHLHAASSARRISRPPTVATPSREPTSARPRRRRTARALGPQRLRRRSAFIYLFTPIFVIVLFTLQQARAATSTSCGRSSRSTTGRTRSPSRS